MNTSSRLISTLCLASLSVTGFITPSVFAAPPPLTVAQPVQVQVVNTAAAPAQVEVVKTVQVQGLIETLDDVVHQPYVQTQSILVGANEGAVLGFTIPAGKRLVIETVTVEAEVDLGQRARVALNGRTLDGTFFELYLSVQKQEGSIDNLWVGTHPLRLRLDGTINPTGPAFRIISSSASQQIFKASVTGYLVDL